MLVVKLEEHLEFAIARIAKATGSTKSSVVRDAVLRYVGDREDAALALRAKKTRGRAKSIAEVRKTLGLEQ